jgi:hypothetical protein
MGTMSSVFNVAAIINNKISPHAPIICLSGASFFRATIETKEN